MIIDFELSEKEFSTLDEIHNIVEAKIREVKINSGTSKIAYVAGKVTADGPLRIVQNLERLKMFTNQVSEEEKVYVFSAAHIFDTNVYWKLNLPSPDHEREFYKFWRKVLKSGVTDIYMSPDWEASLGATDEFVAAKEINLTIHYI